LPQVVVVVILVLAQAQHLEELVELSQVALHQFTHQEQEAQEITVAPLEVQAQQAQRPQ
jgi:hypothetical protein